MTLCSQNLLETLVQQIFVFFVLIDGPEPSLNATKIIRVNRIEDNESRSKPIERISHSKKYRNLITESSGVTEGVQMVLVHRPE